MCALSYHLQIHFYAWNKPHEELKFILPFASAETNTDILSSSAVHTRLYKLFYENYDANMSTKMEPVRWTMAMHLDEFCSQFERKYAKPDQEYPKKSI